MIDGVTASTLEAGAQGPILEGHVELVLMDSLPLVQTYQSMDRTHGPNKLPKTWATKFSVLRMNGIPSHLFFKTEFWNWTDFRGATRTENLTTTTTMVLSSYHSKLRKIIGSRVKNLNTAMVTHISVSPLRRCICFKHGFSFSNRGKLPPFSFHNVQSILYFLKDLQ